MVLPVSAPAAGEIVKAANPAAGDAIKNKVIAEFDAWLSNLSNLSFFRLSFPCQAMVPGWLCGGYKQSDRI